MGKRDLSNTSRTALGGIVAALSVVTMFLTAVIPTLTYALPAVAGVFLVLMVVDVGKKWALGVYAAVSILSLLILPDKEAAVMYVFFFGHYPIVKAVLEGTRLHGIVLWLVKLLVFNACVVLAYLVILYVFQLPFDELEEYGKWAAVGLLGLGNVVFVIYDVAVSRLVTLYMLKLRRYVRKLLRFK